MRYLVTGAAGFIGSHIVSHLVERGDDVLALDNLSSGYKRNLAGVWDQIEFVEGDVRDRDCCESVCKRVDHVLHQAALSSVPQSIKDPQSSHAVNATGTLHLLTAARDTGVRSFVYAASTSIYGNAEEFPIREDTAAQPLSPYATSKAAGEFYTTNFGRLFDLPTVSLRYFNIFGPRQDPHGPYAAVIPNFIQQLLRSERPTIHGDGNQTRDFAYVSNVVNANLLASQNAASVSGEVFNIGCGEQTSINELYRLIAHEVGTDIQPTYGDPRAGDVRHSVADVSKAVANIGYSVQVGVREGLAKTIEWYRRNQEVDG